MLDNFDPHTFTTPLGGDTWHVRGLLLQACLRMAKEQVDGGVAAVRDALPEQHRAYFQQRFAALTWYDAHAALVLLATIAKLRGRTLTETAYDYGVHACRNDMQVGPHAMIVRIMKPRQIGRYIPRVSDFFMRCYESAKTREVSATEVAVEVKGLPGVLGLLMLHLAHAYALELLRACGARDPRYSFGPLSTGVDGAITVTTSLVWDAG